MSLKLLRMSTVMFPPSSLTLITTPSFSAFGKLNLCFFCLPFSFVIVTSARYLAPSLGVSTNEPFPICDGVVSSNGALSSYMVIFSSPKSPFSPRSSYATRLSSPETRLPPSGKNASDASGSSALIHLPLLLNPLRRSSMFLKSQLSALTLSNTGNTRLNMALLSQLSMYRV